MEKTLKLNSNDEAIALYGSLDENLRYAEQQFQVRVSARNNRLRIIGDKPHVDKAYRFFNDRLKNIRSGKRHGEAHGAKHADAPERAARPKYLSGYVPSDKDIKFFHRGRVIEPRSENQAKYLEAIRTNDIVFSIGPAGTGKTYLAMAAAIDCLKRKLVARIILTRPAVEAGESLGFLPGDLQAKVNPYLRPLYDALYDMMDYEEAVRYLERGVIEVAPLAYMRGRTLGDAFVILDEAQNTTHPQMKMFLTRLGEHSKSVITGDITQIDLPGGKKSGLVEAKTILANVKGIQFMYLDDTDVVRHVLVQEIIKAYDRFERKN